MPRFRPARASIVKATVEKLGGLHILVNNAAHQGKSVKDLSELDPSRVEPTFRVNVFALFETVRQAVPHMKPGSVIINTASIQGFDPKAADAALAHELAAMGLL